MSHIGSLEAYIATDENDYTGGFTTDTVKSKIRKSDLPFGSEFSPSQIRLDKVLELAAFYDGDWKALENAIYIEYFTANNTNEYNKEN